MISVRESLRLRLTLIFVGLAVGPPILSSIAIGSFSYITLEQNSIELQKQIAAGVGAEIEAFIRGIEKDLTQLDNVHNLGMHGLTEQRDMLSVLLSQERLYQDFAVIDAAGQEQFWLSRSTYHPFGELKNRTGLDEFQIPIDHEETYFGPLRFDSSIREPLITISIPLYDKYKGRVNSVLLTDLRLKAIWDLLAEIEIPEEIDVCVVDTNGLIIAHKNPAVALRGIVLVVPETDGNGKDQSGRRVIMAKTGLQFGSQNLSVVAIQSVSSAHALANRSLWILFIVMVVTLVLSIGFVLLLNQQVFSPVQQMSAAAQDVIRGDLSEKINGTLQEVSKPSAVFSRLKSRRGADHSQRADEIGTLARSFSRMVETIRERESLLKDQKKAIMESHEELELKVASRTEELESANKNLRMEIAERKSAQQQISESLKEKEILLKEIHHRVKNNMQIIISLLNLQSSNIQNEEAQEKIQDSQSRIQTMALIHEKLYQSGDLARINIRDYIESLVSSLSHSLWNSSTAVRTHIKVNDVLTNIDTAIPCGLIINELVLNSLKYAFSGLEEGEIWIDMVLDDTGQYTLTVGDNGAGIPEDIDLDHLDSMGLQIVKTLTEEQLHGHLEHQKCEGTVFTISFPAEI